MIDDIEASAWIAVFVFGRDGARCRFRMFLAGLVRHGVHATPVELLERCLGIDVLV